MHKLLLRQLKRCGLTMEQIPDELRALIEAIGDAYDQSDHDRQLLERSLELTSQELLGANAELRRDQRQLEHAVRDRTAELEREIAERRQAEEAIRASEAKYRRLFEGSRDAIYISTPSGRLLDINPAGIELFGYESKEEMLSLDIPQDLYVSVQERAEFRAAMAQDGFVRDMDVSVTRRDGRILTVQISATAERDDSGEIASYRGILRDVTVRRELEESLHRAQRMESIGRLAGGVAHDFNNLLTAILGYTELCDRHVPDAGPVRGHLEEIRGAATRGGQLTSQLLAFSRRQVLSPKVLDLNAVVREMERLLRRVIGEDVDFRVELGPQLGHIRADGAQLEQVLLNLVVNARDAMPSGGTMHIRTQNVVLEDPRACRRLHLDPGTYVVLEAQDDGIGMEAEVCERVFEPFFTTKPQGKGTGLGLSTVYGIVEQSGGRIDLRTEPGHGSTFTIYLPTTTDALETGEAPEDAVLPRKSTETVLVVEDEDAVRTLLRDVLETGGFDVVTARNGREGLAQLRELDGGVDLLLTDVVMPRMSGTELIQLARAQWPELPIMLISGYTDQPDAVLCEGLPGPTVHFLQKPFAPQALIARLHDILERPEDAARTPTSAR